MRRIGEWSGAMVFLLACSGIRGSECNRIVRDLSDPEVGGDLNGDTSFDVSDMVYGLLYKFSDGSPPCPLVLDQALVEELSRVVDLKVLLAGCEESQSQLRSDLEASRNQVVVLENERTSCGEISIRARRGRRSFLYGSRSWRISWRHVGRCLGCGNRSDDMLRRSRKCHRMHHPDFPGQDAFYQAGCPSTNRFQDNGDGTVTDNCTGLMWQKPEDVWFNSWFDAVDYSENLPLAGRVDWRLPNIKELHSIIDYGRNNPALHPMFGASGALWSSTTSITNPTFAWVADLGHGVVTEIRRKALGFG